MKIKYINYLWRLFYFLREKENEKKRKEKQIKAKKVIQKKHV